MSDQVSNPLVYRPPEEILRKLITYKIAVIKDGKYVYSPEIEASVDVMLKDPPGRIQQIRWGTQARRIAKAIVLYASALKSRHNLENLLRTYAVLKFHIKRLNIKIDKKIHDDIVYASWYLNDHEPEVWEDT